MAFLKGGIPVPWFSTLVTDNFCDSFEVHEDGPQPVLPSQGDSTPGLQQGIDHRDQVVPGWFTRAREQTPSNRAGCQRRPQVLLGQLWSLGCCASSSKGGGASAFLGVSCALYLVADPGRSRQKFSASSASWLFLLGQSLQDADNDQRLSLFCVSWRDRFQKGCARRLGVLLGR